MANEKVISSSALIALFQQALDDHWGYIWGQAGTLWTQADQDKLDKTTDSDRANSRKYGAKWIGHRVADCSGLFSWAFAKLGGYMYHGSNTMWNKYCTAQGDLKNGKRTDGKPLLPGTAVFTYNASTNNRGHVGLYIGNAWVIEASGPKDGVIRSKVSNKKWVEWGELKGVSYEATAPETGEQPPEKDQQTASLPTLRRGSKNKYVTLAQTELKQRGYNLGICGVDGDFGSATEAAVKQFQRDWGLEADGIIGPKTWAMLQNTPAKEVTYTVTIPGLSKAEAQEICRKYKGSGMKEE